MQYLTDLLQTANEINEVVKGKMVSVQYSQIPAINKYNSPHLSRQEWIKCKCYYAAPLVLTHPCNFPCTRNQLTHSNMATRPRPSSSSPPALGRRFESSYYLLVGGGLVAGWLLADCTVQRMYSKCSAAASACAALYMPAALYSLYNPSSSCSWLLFSENNSWWQRPALFKLNLDLIAQIWCVWAIRVSARACLQLYNLKFDEDLLLVIWKILQFYLYLLSVSEVHAILTTQEMTFTSSEK